MSNSFADEIREAAAAKKQALVGQERARQEQAIQQTAERHARIARAVELMDDAWQAVAQGLTAAGFSVTVKPHDVSENGKHLQRGHVVTIARPSASNPEAVITVDYNGFVTLKSRKGESHEGRGLRITTPDEAKDLVRGILKELELL